MDDARPIVKVSKPGDMTVVVVNGDEWSMFFTLDEYWFITGPLSEAEEDALNGGDGYGHRLKADCMRVFSSAIEARYGVRIEWTNPVWEQAR